MARDDERHGAGGKRRVDEQIARFQVLVNDARRSGICSHQPCPAKPRSIEGEQRVLDASINPHEQQPGQSVTRQKYERRNDDRERGVGRHVGGRRGDEAGHGSGGEQRRPRLTELRPEERDDGQIDGVDQRDRLPVHG